MSNKSVVNPYLNVSKYAISVVIDTVFPKEILEPIIKAVHDEYENYRRKELGSHIVSEIPYKVFTKEIVTPINPDQIYEAIISDYTLGHVKSFKLHEVSYNSQIHHLFDGDNWIYYLSSIMTIKNVDDDITRALGTCKSYRNITKTKSTTSVIFIDCNKYDERMVHLHEISHVFANLFMGGYRVEAKIDYWDSESISNFIAVMVLYNYYNVSTEELEQFFDKSADTLIAAKFFETQEQLDIYMAHADCLIKKLYKIESID